jgi:hypothetical protein
MCQQRASSKRAIVRLGTTAGPDHQSGARARARDARRSGLVRARRGMQIAVVATARKLAVLCWHLITRSEDYAYGRPLVTNAADDQWRES